MIYVDYGFPFPKFLPDPHHLSTHINSCTPSKIFKKKTKTKIKTTRQKIYQKKKKPTIYHGACLVLASYFW